VRRWPVGAAQAVEHYEISRYGTLKAWAQKLGLEQAVALLEETLQQEKKTDADLTKIAEERNQRGGRSGLNVSRTQVKLTGTLRALSALSDDTSYQITPTALQESVHGLESD